MARDEHAALRKELAEMEEKLTKANLRTLSFGAALDNLEAVCKDTMQERDELRKAILDLGVLEGPDEWLTDRGDCVIRMQPSKRDAWNKIVDKLCGKQPKEGT